MKGFAIGISVLILTVVCVLLSGYWITKITVEPTPEENWWEANLHEMRAVELIGESKRLSAIKHLAIAYRYSNHVKPPSTNSSKGQLYLRRTFIREKIWATFLEIFRGQKKGEAVTPNA